MDNIKKWGSLAAFIVLAAISCWATEHSFHLLIRWMPEAFVWGLTIAFFVVASYGTKLIVDALNTDLWMEHRRRSFWIGTVLVLVFWLMMSMPTNTHTFFYNHKIGTVVQDDIAATNGYLSQIKNRTNIDSTYYDVVYNPVMDIYKDMAREFNGIGYSEQRGNGQYVHDAIDRMNTLLKAQPHGSSVVFINRWNVFDPAILQEYQNQTEVSLAKIMDEDFKVAKSEASIATEDMRKLTLMNDTIKTMVELGTIHEDVITQAEGVILSGYTCVKNNKDKKSKFDNKFVKFSDKADEELYTAENIETRTKRMLSVIDVWLDFFAGKYPISYFFYILLSILVDVAAFMFFDFAFKQED